MDYTTKLSNNTNPSFGMERDKERQKAAEDYCNNLIGEATFGMYVAHKAGSKWADEHPHWISVEDELPPKDGRYLFYDTFLGPRVSAYYVECTLVKEITHWMPLPTPPKEGD